MKSSEITMKTRKGQSTAEIETQCPNCKAIFNIPIEYENHNIKCLKCKKTFSALEYKPIPIVIPDLPSKPPDKIRCPKCSSDQIFAGKKGFSGGKAVGGALVLGPLGILAGLHGSKKINLTCLNCGHEWLV